MRNSYSGNARNNAASFIDRNGFEGQNEGWLTNGLRLAKSGYELYKSVPAHLRYKLFKGTALGDEAFREDQETPNPYYNPDGTIRVKSPEEQAEYDAEHQYDDAVVEGKVSDHDEYDNPNGQEAWDAGQLASAQHEEMKSANSGNTNVYDDRPDQYNLEKEQTKVDTAKADESLQFEDGKDQVKEWQKYLKDQGYDIAVDGVWGKKSQSAYDDWSSKHPQE